MPYYYEHHHINLPRHLDKRVKITDKQKQEIRALHKDGMKIRKIADKFQDVCSRRMIQFILFPERLKAVQQAQRRRHLESAESYYKPEHYQKYIAPHRKSKKERLDAAGYKERLEAHKKNNTPLPEDM